MDIDIFAAVAHSLSGSIHNVQLLNVQPAESGFELLTVEHTGTTRQLIGAGRWDEEFSRRDVGKFGCIRPARRFAHDAPADSCYFHSYIDQSLRRVPDLDSSDRTACDDGRAPEVVGWRCDARPHGFRAPVGIIPGEAGRFVPDETVAVTLRVPPEFVRECHRVQTTPEELLRSFVGDLAGIQNFSACPRADGYGSNGSDERDYADAWLGRAHGMNAIDLDMLDNRRMEAEEEQAQRDEFAALLDDFLGHGGKPNDLFAAVQTLVDKQAES